MRDRVGLEGGWEEWRGVEGVARWGKGMGRGCKDSVGVERRDGGRGTRWEQKDGVRAEGQ